MSSDKDSEDQDQQKEDITPNEVQKENIKECSINLKRIPTPATISSRLIRNSNEYNLQMLSTIDHEDEHLNYEFELSTENDPPNNYFTPEEFCQDNQGLINIVNTMINRRNEHDNEPFDIERTIAGGLRVGTWALNIHKSKDGKSHYINSKLDDNNRILQTKEIETMYFFPELAAPKGSKTNVHHTKDDAKDDSKSRDLEIQDQIADNESEENEVEMKIEIEDEDGGEDRENTKPIEITQRTRDA